MLKQRLLFGTLLVFGFLGLFLLDGFLETVTLGDWAVEWFGRSTFPPGIPFLVLIVILTPIAAKELAAILRAKSIHTSSVLISICSLATAATIFWMPEQSQTINAPTGMAIIASVWIGSFVATLIWHSRNASIEGVVASAAATMLSVAYLGLAPGFLLAMRRWHSAWAVLAILLITKMGDTGAYFTGRAIGKHKLIPWVSPGKTWEGLAGAVIWSTLFAVGFAWLSQNTSLTEVFRVAEGETTPHAVARPYHMGVMALGGVLLALVGHAGDLTMSLFKRDAGIKDSGTLIPGMGGVLDVLDSPLLAAPVAYWMLAWASRAAM
jgi:phosphatidate cytidylyltransferase